MAREVPFTLKFSGCDVLSDSEWSLVHFHPLIFKMVKKSTYVQQPVQLGY